MRHWPTQIRTRLTLWYVGIFSGVLAAYIAAACMLQYWQLRDQLYRAEIQDIETVQGLLYFDQDGRLSLREDYFNRPQSRLLLDRMMEVLDENGRVLFRNRKLNGNELGGSPSPNEGIDGFSPRRLLLSDGTHVLAISHIHTLQGKPLLIRVGYSTEPLRRRSMELLGLLALALPLALVATGLAGYCVAGKALNPLEQMARLTEHITVRRLSNRLPVQNRNDEFGHMAIVLNGLLGRLEESFAKLQRFTSDVSHELRTPLAAMRSVGEVALQGDHDTEGYRDVIGSMLEEVARLNSMVDTLLTISHADSGAIALHRTVSPLMDLVKESVVVVAVLAEEKNQTIAVAGDEEITIWADQSFLRMALINILDNAVKYSPVGSAIKLSLRSNGPCGEESFAELDIADEGPGIPDEARQRIFDRFYRLDEARTRDVDGVGLGLPIAKWAVEAHGGKITVRSNQTHGAVFSILLPAINGPHFSKEKVVPLHGASEVLSEQGDLRADALRRGKVIEI